MLVLLVSVMNVVVLVVELVDVFVVAVVVPLDVVDVEVLVEVGARGGTVDDGGAVVGIGFGSTTT